jgi:diacylglycerol kinase (ATP)
MKTFLICNPAAGGIADRKALLKKLKAAFGSSIWFTKSRGDATRLARRAIRNGFDYIIAAGGDGTLNEVIDGIGSRAKKVQAGLLPLGTGNDFARTLELPSSVEDNIDILLSQRTRKIDLVRVESDRVRYFVNVSAGGGFSGMGTEKLTPKLKQRWGPLAYVRGAAEMLSELHGYRTRIVLEERREFSADLYTAIVANGRYVACGLPIAPKADPSDGRLDVVLISKQTKAKALLVAPQILLGSHLGSDAVTFRRVTKISIRSRPGMWFTADGEMIGKAPAHFAVVPRALRFVVGNK